MKIFVRGLPTEISPVSLHAFAKTILTPAWYQPFRQKIQIKRCVVLKIKDLELHTTEYHGLIQVAPYKAAIEAIERLNLQKFHGRLLAARKWYDRSDLNERRRALRAEEGPFADDRRGAERRRPQLVVETYVPPDFKGLQQFYREFD